MRLTMTFAVAAAALATALPAMAQSTGAAGATAGGSAAAQPSASAPAPAGTASGATSSATTAAATLAVGLPVKDKTGAVIGEITELKPAADGQTATVKMGDQMFAIGAQSFVVQGGAAVINATQAELKAMIANAAKAG